MNRAAIFDVDGTLIDSVAEHALAWQEAFEQFGHHISFKEVRDQIGKGGDQLLPVFLSEHQVRKEGKQIEAVRSTIFRLRYMDGLRSFPKVKLLIVRLRAEGWKVALASSAKKSELEIYEEKCGIANLLDAETSADDVKRSKPYPDIFKAVVRKLHEIPAERCVVVGDSPFDAIAATRAGMKSVGFLCGGFGRNKLKKAGAQHLYQDASDLLRNFDHSIFNQNALSA